MLGPEPSRCIPSEGRFVPPRFTEAYREGVQQVRRVAGCIARDETRVDAATAECAKRHVAHELRLYCPIQQRVEPFGRRSLAPPRLAFRARRVPIPPDCEGPVLPHGKMTGRESLDPLEERAIPSYVAKRQ